MPIVRKEVPANLEVREELDAYGDGEIELGIHLLDESASDGNAIIGHSSG